MSCNLRRPAPPALSPSTAPCVSANGLFCLRPALRCTCFWAAWLTCCWTLCGPCRSWDPCSRRCVSLQAMPSLHARPCLSLLACPLLPRCVMLRMSRASCGRPFHPGLFLCPPELQWRLLTRRWPMRFTPCLLPSWCLCWMRCGLTLTTRRLRAPSCCRLVCWRIPSYSPPWEREFQLRNAFPQWFEDLPFRRRLGSASTACSRFFYIAHAVQAPCCYVPRLAPFCSRMRLARFPRCWRRGTAAAAIASMPAVGRGPAATWPLRDWSQLLGRNCC